MKDKMHRTTEEMILFEPLQCGDYSLMRRVSNKRKGAGSFIEAEADKQRTHPRIL